MADKANPESEYQRMAKTRWRQYAISGNGPFAVVLGCAYRVELCEMQMLAQVIASERCGPLCNHVRTPDGGWHKIERIELPRPRALVTIRDWTD
jgi:hypothetical protein